MKLSHLFKKLTALTLAASAAFTFCACDLFGGKKEAEESFVSDPIKKAYNAVNSRYGGNVPLDKLSEYTDALYEEVGKQESEGEIAYREKGASYVYVRDKNNRGIFLCAPNNELAAGSGLVSYYSFQPFYSDFSSVNVRTQLVDDTEAVYSGLSFVDPAHTVKKDTDFTVEDAKHIGSNSVVLWDGHGIYSSDYGSCLSLTVPFTSRYADDFNAGRVCIGEINGEEHIVLTPEFFDYYYKDGDLQDDVIFLGTCEGAKDRSDRSKDHKQLTQVLEDKGAKAVFASTDTIYTFYCHEMEYSVLRHMAQGKTAANALRAAWDENGETDYTPELKPDKPAASFKAFGEADFTLKRQNTYTNAAYGWSVDIPDGWGAYGAYTEQGDVDEIEHYGIVNFYHKELYENERMGQVFSIFAVPSGSRSDNGKDGGTASGGFLGRNGKYAFYYSEATALQADPSSPDYGRYSEELSKLNGYKNEIISSFRIN